MTLDECKAAARQGGCYVVTKYDPKHGEIYILYRKNGERGLKIAKRSSVSSLAALIKKACATT